MTRFWTDWYWQRTVGSRVADHTYAKYEFQDYKCSFMLFTGTYFCSLEISAWFWSTTSKNGIKEMEYPHSLASDLTEFSRFLNSIAIWIYMLKLHMIKAIAFDELQKRKNLILSLRTLKVQGYRHVEQTRKMIEFLQYFASKVLW